MNFDLVYPPPPHTMCCILREITSPDSRRCAAYVSQLTLQLFGSGSSPNVQLKLVIIHANFVAFACIRFHFEWKTYLKNKLLNKIKLRQTCRLANPLRCCRKYYCLAINLSYVITFCVKNVVIFSKTHRGTFYPVNRPKQTSVSLLDTGLMSIYVHLL